METLNHQGNKHDILLSVIVPVYNAGLYIRACINSILLQDFQGFELILIDDGSIDCSGNICDEYQRKDNRVKVIHKVNEGVSIARNTALDLIRGEWIVFADADDYLLPGALQHLYNKTKMNNPDAVLAGFNILINNCERQGVSYEERESAYMLREISHPALWCYMFRASVIQDNNIRFVPGLAYSEDRVFLYEFALHCRHIIYSSKSIYTYRHNNNSACNSTNGMRKVLHQFHAADVMNKVLSQLRNKKIEYNKAYHEQQIILMMGATAYVTYSFSWKTYKTYESYYLKYFDNRYRLLFITIKALITYYRRKLIVFKSSPLGEEKALIDLSKIRKHKV